MIRDRGRGGRLHLSGCRSGKLWIDEEWEPKRFWAGTVQTWVGAEAAWF